MDTQTRIVRSAATAKQGKDTKTSEKAGGCFWDHGDIAHLNLVRARISRVLKADAIEGIGQRSCVRECHVGKVEIVGIALE